MVKSCDLKETFLQEESSSSFKLVAKRLENRLILPRFKAGAAIENKTIYITGGYGKNLKCGRILETIELTTGLGNIIGESSCQRVCPKIHVLNQSQICFIGGLDIRNISNDAFIEVIDLETEGIYKVSGSIDQNWSEARDVSILKLSKSKLLILGNVRDSQGSSNKVLVFDIASREHFEFKSSQDLG